MASLQFSRATYLVTAAIYAVVSGPRSQGARARAFKAVSPGMLPPLGIIFGLFVAFIAAQVWSDNDHAISTVDREASALNSVVILAAAFPGEPETRYARPHKRLHCKSRSSGMADDGLIVQQRSG